MAYNVSALESGKADIKIVRGDTFVYPFNIYTESKLKYVPNAGDTITLQVFNKFTDTKPIYEKNIPYKSLFINLSADETKSMKYGNYVYVIRIRFSNGFVDSVISGKFSVTVPGGD